LEDRKLNIVILEASHWHVPLYFPGIEKRGLRVVGVSDRDAFAGQGVAALFGCPLYSDYRLLLDGVDGIDFAFVFGRHADMAEMGRALVDRRIPFAVEKPCGVNSEEVAGLRKAAEQAGVYVAVPFIQRLGGLCRGIEELEGGLPSTFGHVSIRFMAGPPERYLSTGCKWMLDPAQSGGGCLVNLGGHFVDLARVITGNEVTHVHCRTSNKLHDTQIEDFAVLTMTMTGGEVFTIETGYTFPMTDDEQREFSFSVGSAKSYLRSIEGGFRSYRGQEDVRDHRVDLETDHFYPVFVDHVIEEVRAGKPPSVGLREAEAVQRVIDAAYISAREGHVVEIAGAIEE
jgi:predicted dehydrogenase